MLDILAYIYAYIRVLVPNDQCLTPPEQYPTPQPQHRDTHCTVYSVQPYNYGTSTVMGSP